MKEFQCYFLYEILEINWSDNIKTYVKAEQVDLQSVSKILLLITPNKIYFKLSDVRLQTNNGSLHYLAP